MRDAVLELVRQHGCVTLGALLRLAGSVTRSQAEYMLRRLWREGMIARYALGRVDVWCVGNPRSITAPCGRGVARLNARALAEALAACIARRPARGLAIKLRVLLPPCPDIRGRAGPPGALADIAVAALLRALDGAARVSRRVRGGRVLVVADPWRALERLRRLAETGDLPLEQVPPPLPRGQPRERGRRMALLSVHVPRKMLEVLDGLVGRGAYRSRSEAVRDAIRRLLERYGMYRMAEER